VIIISVKHIKKKIVFWKIVHRGVIGLYGILVIEHATVKENGIATAICLRY